MTTAIRLLGAAFLLLAALLPARADWPTGPVRIIVPFAPGASTDIVARRLAPRLGELLGQPVVIENRGGAGGLIGAQAAIAAAPDGHTLFVATTSHSALPALHDKMPYDTLKDFVSVALLADMPGIIVINPKLPVRTFPEFLDYAKKNTLTFGTAGPGTFPHLGIELLKSRAKIPMTHVSYRGAAPALADTVAGHVDVKLDAYVTASGHIAAGRLRAVAVTSLTRIPELPDLPAAAEFGLPGYEVNYWIGIVTRAGLPEAARAKLEKAFIESMTEENRAALAKSGVRPLGQSSKELDALIQREFTQWRDLVKQAGLTVN
jgi:tripartite-type tricarboxylate transporter receptor subunit TctC